MGAGLKFMVDTNAGKLARWLRMMGYDAVFFKDGDDAEMISQALKEGRVIITRDHHIVKRWVATSGRLRVVLVTSDQPERQMQQVISELGLDGHFEPFTRCLECNQPLGAMPKEAVKRRVPPYVYRTQADFLECPACRRIYWRGSHREAMRRKLERLFPVDRDR
ncbi:MAG: Mut7-C RNAse domain-containing protein [Chloroflexota bacterium]